MLQELNERFSVTGGQLTTDFVESSAYRVARDRQSDHHSPVEVNCTCVVWTTWC